jgi:site-specific DNA recombinase
MQPSNVIEEADTVDLGVSYLRVSSKRQLDTAADIDPDGNSINTQREYTQTKARAMKVMVEREFVEPGISAQTIEKRKVFRELLRYLDEHPDVKYVFIYMRSRAFRNYLEAGNTEHMLNERGVKLISAKEEFGEGIMADAMKAVTDIMNEVQVKLSGQDISTKMHNKVKNGGTVTLAKIGYSNARIDIDGHKVNTILIDQQRAPLVARTFELFGTGLHTLDSLHEIMTDAGLTAPGRTNPISRETLARMLRDRYYVGKVLYKGVEYQGRHEPLVDDELFNRVQRIMDAHTGSGTRERKHLHFLKGLVWCGRCQHRFTIMPGRGNGGEYFYFLCRGRQQKLCDQPYIPVDIMEKAVEQHYAHAVILPPELRAAVRGDIEEAVAEHFELSDDMRATLTKQLDKLDAKESYFLDLAAEEGWPKDKLRAKLTAIRQEQTKLTRQLHAATSQLETGRQVFLTALDLLDDPHAMYVRAGENETVKSILNRAFFTRLYVDGGKVTDHELNEPFDLLSDAYTVYRDEQVTERVRGHKRTYRRTSGGAALVAELPAQRNSAQTARSADLPEETGATCRNDLIGYLTRVFAGHGSSNRVMVGLTGFEPATLRSQSGCATKLRYSPCTPRCCQGRPDSVSRRARLFPQDASAGVAQWQSPSLPSWSCGFDSRHPLQNFPPRSAGAPPLTR